MGVFGCFSHNVLKLHKVSHTVYQSAIGQDRHSDKEAFVNMT